MAIQGDGVLIETLKDGYATPTGVAVVGHTPGERGPAFVCLRSGQKGSVAELAVSYLLGGAASSLKLAGRLEYSIWVKENIHAPLCESAAIPSGAPRAGLLLR